MWLSSFFENASGRGDEEKRRGSVYPSAARSGEHAAAEHDGTRADPIGERAPEERPMPMKSQFRRATVEIPVRDQPIDSEIGSRKTLSENIAPSSMHVTRMPAPTMIQP